MTEVFVQEERAKIVRNELELMKIMLKQAQAGAAKLLLQERHLNAADVDR